MIVVTGAAGFIGSNLVRALNARGYANIVAVDDLSDGRKMFNLADCKIADYLDKDEFLAAVKSDTLSFVPEVIFHQGACSSTTEWDGKYMMRNNYQYSKDLLEYCQLNVIPFIYASSASVYGGSESFEECESSEKPLNVYAYSKFLFDQYVRSIESPTAQIVGLRYFNVYGPFEQHKGSMASVIHHFSEQIKASNACRLFEGDNEFENGGQRRDFVFVEDVVAVNLWFWQHPTESGIFNCGTGEARSFNDVALAVIDFHQTGKISYIPFPDSLKGAYQRYTCADLTQLRATGCNHIFSTIEQGVAAYLSQVNDRMLAMA